MIKKRAQELDFISRILRDGSGAIPVDQTTIDSMRKENEEYTLHRLSISEDTYIAFNFNAFVVRIKKEV